MYALFLLLLSANDYVYIKETLEIYCDNSFNGDIWLWKDFKKLYVLLNILNNTKILHTYTRMYVWFYTSQISVWI